MKTISITAIILLALMHMLWGQQNHAVNQRLVADDHKLTITYDLPPHGTHRVFHISLKVGDPDIRPRTVQGTGKNVLSDTNRTVIWYYPADGYSKADITGKTISVVATDPLGETTDAVPERLPATRAVSPWLGLGSMATTGAGLLGYGAIEEIRAQDDYTTYKENRNPEMSVYAEQSREALFEDANARHKRAQYLMVGGGVILAGTAAMLIKRITDRKRMARQTDAHISWEIQPGSMAANQVSAVPLNFALKFRF